MRAGAAGAALAAVLAAALGLAALAACRDRTLGVRVECTVAGPRAVECVAERIAGDRSIEACWDLAVVCGDGRTVTVPSRCAEVHGGGPTVVAIELGTEACARAPSSVTVVDVRMKPTTGR